MTRWMVPRAAVLAAAALLCVSILTAWLVPLFDPDEGYYPATAAESMDAGRSWDLRFNGGPRWDKPVLAYALIQSAFSILGRSDGAARVPSALEGAALVLAVGGLVGILAGAGAGGLSAVVLSTTLGVQVFSRVAHPEIALALSIGVTQLLLTCWLLLPAKDRPKRLPLLIGLSMGYGLLAKGPVALAIPALGVMAAAPFVLDLRAAWRVALRDGLIAGVIAIAVAAPWFTAMTLRHGTAFLRDAVWQQNVARYTGQLAVHASASPLYYVVPTFVALLPWTALLPSSLARLRRPRRGTRREDVRFCLAIMAGATFAFYSLSASKLASYILGLLPSVSVLVGLYLDEELTGAAPASPMAYRATGGLLALAAAVLIAVPFATGRVVSTRDLTGGVPGPGAAAMLMGVALPIAAVFLAGSVLVIVLRARARVLTLFAVGACVPLVAVLAARPLVAAAYPWEQFGARIARDPAPVWLDTFRAPSLTFYAGRRVERLDGEADLNGVIAGGNGWLVVGEERTTSGPLRARLGAKRASIVGRSGRLVLVRLTS